MKMNKGLKSGLLVFFLIFLFPLLKLNADLEVPFDNPEITISMDFQDVSLKDILKIFSIQSGLNFIASEGVQDRKVTLYMDKVAIKEAMDKIFKANNLAYELDKEDNIFIVKDLGKLETETVTKVFYLQYATVSSSSLKEEMSKQVTSSESSFAVASGGGGSSGGTGTGSGGKWKTESEAGITTAIKKMLSDRGSIIEDFRTNSLVVTDTPIRMPVIEKVIASLDLPVPQILLEVEMLDVSKNTVDNMGVLFGQTPFKVGITGATAALGTGFPFGSWVKTFTSSANRGSLSINPNEYAAQLDFLRTQTDTKFLARPRILTLNNETAEIRIATNESIGVKTTTEASTSTTSAEAERTETGVILRVTPQINIDAGEITMFVYPKVAEAIAGNTLTSAGQSFNYRDPEERSTKSIVRVKDGETVVIGGLIRNEMTNIQTKVPFFGDLPIIGALFRHTGNTGSNSGQKNKTRELLVFITPHIVKDSAFTLVKARTTVSLPEREQGLTSAVDRDKAIASSLDVMDDKKKR